MDDSEARQQLLEEWIAQRQGSGERPVRPPSRAKTAGAKLWHQVAGRFERLADRWFERGLDTAGSRFEPEHDHPDRVRYVASGWHVLPRALRYIGVSDDDTFVDFGCGKGRVLHQAAKRPFRRVIGVEISPVLAEIARSNLAARSREHRCKRVEVVVADVRDYRVPDDLTVGYFFQPFKHETFDVVLNAIIDSIDRQPRRVRLIYLLPLQESEILATGRFRVLTRQRSRAVSLPPVAIFESV